MAFRHRFYSRGGEIGPAGQIEVVCSGFSHISAAENQKPVQRVR